MTTSFIAAEGNSKISYQWLSNGVLYTGREYILIWEKLLLTLEEKEV